MTPARLAAYIERLGAPDGMSLTHSHEGVDIDCDGPLGMIATSYHGSILHVEISKPRAMEAAALLLRAWRDVSLGLDEEVDDG